MEQSAYVLHDTGDPNVFIAESDGKFTPIEFFHPMTTTTAPSAGTR